MERRSTWLRFSFDVLVHGPAMRSSTSCQGLGIGFSSRGPAHQQDGGAGGGLPLMCKLDSASVFTGQVRVIAKPASISPTVRASQAAVDL